MGGKGIDAGQYTRKGVFELSAAQQAAQLAQ